MAQIDLDIAGMTCGHCVRHVREALAKVRGVKTIDVQIGHARIEAGSLRLARIRLRSA